jgi:hypothetical protein
MANANKNLARGEGTRQLGDKQAFPTDQIYTIVNGVSQQSMGETAITAVDTASLVALGNSVLSSQSNTEGWLNTLTQRIGSTIISYRMYTSDLSLLVVDDMTMGAILQKIKVDMPQAIEDVSTQLQDGQSIDMFIVSKPTVHEKLFVKRTPYDMMVTIQRKWIKEAFTSVEAMGAFFNAVFGEVRNALELAQENLARLAIANYIAQTGANQRIHLVTEYNAKSTDTVTAATALTNEGFLRYAMGRMRTISKRMRTMSTLYNKEGMQRHTPLDMQRFITLIDFMSAMETQVEYKAFHTEYVTKAVDVEVPYWQGAEEGKEDSIDLTIEGTEEEVTMSGIMGLIVDRDAIGTYRKEEEVATTPYNARGKYYNQFYSMNDLYFNDLSENGVVFLLD